jgi:hypothetical protein
MAQLKMQKKEITNHMANAELTMLASRKGLQLDPL